MLSSVGACHAMAPAVVSWPYMCIVEWTSGVQPAFVVQTFQGVCNVFSDSHNRPMFKRTVVPETLAGHEFNLYRTIPMFDCCAKLCKYVDRSCFCNFFISVHYRISSCGIASLYCIIEMSAKDYFSKVGGLETREVVAQYGLWRVETAHPSCNRNIESRLIIALLLLLLFQK